MLGGNLGSLLYGDVSVMDGMGYFDLRCHYELVYKMIGKVNG